MSVNKNKKTGKYQIDFHWKFGRVRLVAYTDKRASCKLEDNLKTLAACREAGERIDLELSKWLEQLPTNIKAKLAKQGLMDKSRLEAAKAITEHIEDYKSSMKAHGRTDKHINQANRTINKVCTACGFKGLNDINAGKLHKYLVERANKVSARTVNDSLIAMKAFCNWLVRLERLPDNPLRTLQKLDETEKERKRRALSDNDFIRLLTATSYGDKFRKLSGYEWSLFFRLAAETGFRWNELRSLTRAQFLDLEGDNPAIFIEADDAKNSKEYTQPLRKQTALLLADYLRNKLPVAKAFNLPNKDCGAEVVKHYLAQTGNPEQELEPIPYQDAADRYFDFHALRGQFASTLARNNVSITKACELMRHSDINLTKKFYTHFTIDDKRKTINALPEYEDYLQEEAARTGTSDLPVKVDSASQNNAKSNLPEGAKMAVKKTDQILTKQADFGGFTPGNSGQGNNFTKGIDNGEGITKIPENKVLTAVSPTLNTSNNQNARLAQLVEQLTLNQ